MSEAVAPRASPKAMKKAGALNKAGGTTAFTADSTERQRRFSAATGAKLEELDDGGTKCANPFLDMLEEDSGEEDDMVASGVEMDVTIPKASGGFGMEIAESGHVVRCTPGGAAESHDVPAPCRIVGVNGTEVQSKADIVAALKQSGPAAEGATFTFLTKKMVSRQEKAEELQAEGDRLFVEKRYEEALNTLIDAGNLDPYNPKVQQSYQKVREAVLAFQPKQASTEILDGGGGYDDDDDGDDDDDDDDDEESDDDDDDDDDDADGGGPEEKVMALRILSSSGGYGLDITQTAHVTGFTQMVDNPAMAVGVPIPSKIESVNGVKVSNKKEVVAALQTVADGTSAEFVFVFEGGNEARPSKSHAMRHGNKCQREGEACLVSALSHFKAAAALESAPSELLAVVEQLERVLDSCLKMSEGGSFGF
jgi:membrane-associated protease RseP (regulator of RpoE activity)